jgi:two-component system cell cycle sensor histidine kinase/response regulator CckA
MIDENVRLKVNVTEYSETLEDRVEELTRQLEQTQNQLRQSQKMESVGLLASGVAHDFNNLLSSINGYCDLMEMECDFVDERLHQHVREIVKTSERGCKLTRQLLAYGRKRKPQTEEIDLGEILKSMENMLGRLIGDQLSLDVQYNPRPQMVLADWVQVEQVIMNLVVNAYHAMPDGGTISIVLKNVTLESSMTVTTATLDAAEYWEVSVTDTGIGMSQEVISRIFEPFYTTKGEDLGTGLGLSTVHDIIKQIGGGVAVDSKCGKGSIFRLFFPQIKARCNTASP